MSEPEYEPSPEEIAAALRDAREEGASPLERQLKREQKASGRMLPNSEEAELGVICSFFLAPLEVGGLCAEKKVNASWFHSPARGELVEMLLQMWDKGEAIDIVTVTIEAHKRGRLEHMGGAAKIGEYADYLPTALNIDSYLDKLALKKIDRELISVSTTIARESYEPGDTLQRLEKAERNILEIRDSIGKAETHGAKEVVMEAIGQIQDAYERKGSVSGLATGFPRIDAMTMGLQKGQFIVIAARPSHGKTAFAMNIAEELAVNQKRPVAIFSLEMSRAQLMQRLLCSRARVNLFRVMGGHAKDSDFPSITAAAAAISEANMFFDDQSGLTIQELKARARRLKAQQGIEAIFVDYLQLLKSSSRRAQENRSQEVAEVSVGLKEIARELDIPVVVLAQIGRDFEKRTVIRPRLADLRESGAIEQDADFVGFLVREELLIEDEEKRIEAAGKAELMIAKQRNGPIGDVPLTFLKEFVRYESRAEDHDDIDQQMLPV